MNFHSTAHHRMACVDAAHREIAHDGATHTHAANFAKMPSRYRQINPGSATLFPEREAMQNGPHNYPLLPQPGSWAPLRVPAWQARQRTATPTN